MPRGFISAHPAASSAALKSDIFVTTPSPIAALLAALSRARLGDAGGSLLRAQAAEEASADGFAARARSSTTSSARCAIDATGTGGAAT